MWSTAFQPNPALTLNLIINLNKDTQHDFASTYRDPSDGFQFIWIDLGSAGSVHTTKPKLIPRVKA
jgi:hypothetical protein